MSLNKHWDLSFTSCFFQQTRGKRHLRKREKAQLLKHAGRCLILCLRSVLWPVDTVISIILLLYDAAALAVALQIRLTLQTEDSDKT